ncbi:PREDICTED: probable RNA-binding protein EIF1AD [Dufourea novaeangliae]|uniref:Probable RNA-binding protein EIF1AD n=1 Tax=Dufourea novaeangliae TaxID=178035 RepID=A0A154NXU3_DUFNO|nr:PREDICTED: probable RNA-binding protein EIF1AD [Dufourea novaeangliae]XP_015432950.1 PREDICTED: probable RNA-binding protein EIF1AD [Dufourea novaeangliae]KZC04372.1 putative RNA-binding protein EIF1AD [Dufourea novaeangliae]
MSKATKRKHVVKEVQDLSVPTESQSIVRILESRGNNLHEVEDAISEQYLVSMPTKFRRNIWVKRGDFVLVEPIPEGDKVKAEIVKILTREHQKWYRAQNCWPKEFDKASKTNHETTNKGGEDNDSDEDDLFVNTNRLQQNSDRTDNDNESSSDESDSS